MKLSDMRTEVTPQKINKIMESRFGFAIDFDNLAYGKAKRLSRALAENITSIKRSIGAHTAQKNPKYVELLLVKEGLDRWMASEQGLFESEMGKSEAVLAAKDIVDTIQDMLEKVSKMQNEQLPALVDTIRDQIGSEQAEAFKSSVSGFLGNLYQTVSQGREQADTAVRQLAGEEGPAGDMGGFGGDQGGMGGGGMPPELGGDESDLDMDNFAATDAAAGGPETLGRERRGGLGEGKKAKPDYIDLDKDGNRKETMKKAAKDAKAKK